MENQTPKTTFSKISHSFDVILIEGKDQKMQAINNENIKLIGVTTKKVTPPGPSNGGGQRKPPKYFTDFKNEMLDFVKEQRVFNQQMLDFVKRQEEFNKTIIKRIDNLDNRIDNLDKRIDNLVKLNNLHE